MREKCAMRKIMNDDLGFTYIKQHNEYHIFHHAKKATVLCGIKALEFQDELTILGIHEQQQLMARLTGNYKRGNERKAKNHPRNREW